MPKKNPSPSTALRTLESIQAEFGGDAPARKLALLHVLATARLPNAASVLRLHEALCFLHAYPDDEEVLGIVRRLIDTFDQRADLRRCRDDLADSGVAGTLINYPFYASMATWIARQWPDQLTIDWGQGEDAEQIERILSLIAHYGESPGLDEMAFGTREWMRRLAGKRDTDARLLVLGVDALPADAFVKEYLFERLGVWFRLEAGPKTPSRTHARVPGAKVHFQREPQTRARPALPEDIRARPRSVKAVSRAEGQRFVDLARGAMLTRQRDLDVFAYGDPDDVRLIDWGDGLQFACIGAIPERRLLVEAVYGFLTLKNGVPIGYVLISALFGSSEIAYNVFETYRGGEAGFIYGRVLATARHLFGSDTFTVYPYQIGGEGNMEALKSGAWWFYQKLGFRARDPDVLALMNTELKRMKRDRKHRSSIATLKKLAEPNIFYSMGKEREDIIGIFPTGEIGLAVTDYLAARFGADRAKATKTCVRDAAKRLGLKSPSRLPRGEKLAFTRWAPLVLILPGVERWAAAEKKALLAIVRAKGGRRESKFIRRLDKHTKLKRALRKLAGV